MTFVAFVKAKYILLYLFLHSLYHFFSECDGYHWGTNCEKRCECGPGAESCHPLQGCVCAAGWSGSRCDADVLECNQDPCPQGQMCVERPGFYMCACPSGFVKNGSTCAGKFLSDCQGNLLQDV